MQTTHRQILNGVIILLMLAIYAIFSYFAPLMVDDLMFWHKYLLANGGSETPSLHGYWTYLSDLWLYENGRLANMLCAPAILWIPKWMFGIIISAIISSIYVLSARMINGTWRFSPRLLVLVWISYVLFLPWSDYSSMILVDYALNYFPGAFLLLLTICNACRLESMNIGRARYIMALLAGFLVGFFHEGFSLPLVGAFFIIACVNRLRMSLQWWGIFIALLVGTVICIGSPAIWERFFDTVGGASVFQIKPYVRIFIKNTTLFACAVAAIALLVPSKRGRSVLRSVVCDRMDVYLLCVGILGALMAIFLLAPPRASMCSSVVFIILFGRIAEKWIPLGIKRKCSSGVTLCLLGLVCSFYVGVIYWQYKIYKENEFIWRSLALSEKQPIYLDTIRFTPWWTLKHPVSNMWNTGTQAKLYNDLHGIDGPFAPVLPSAFDGADYGALSPVGDSGGYYQMADFIVYRYPGVENEDKLPHNYIFTLSNGMKVGSYVGNLIVSSDDGNKWVIAVPTSRRVKGPFINLTQGN